MSDKSVVELADAIDAFLDVLRKGLDAERLDELLELEITLTQMRALFAVEASESAVTINELAEYLNVSVATAGRTVDRLVSLGMVNRREDPEDRRAKHVTLTVSGRRITEARNEAIRARTRAFAQNLPADIAAALREALLSAIQAVPADADEDITADIARTAHTQTRNSA